MDLIMLVVGISAAPVGIILLSRGRGGETTEIGGISFIVGLLYVWVSANNLFS